MSHDAPAVLVGDLELGAAGGIRSVGPRSRTTYRRAKILVRLHGIPVGFLEFRLPDGPSDPARVRLLAFRELARPISDHLERDGLGFPSDPTLPVLGWEACRDDMGESSRLEPFTVIVCSRDRPAQLAMCLAALAAIRYPRFEVVVVDNAPSTALPAAVFEDTVGGDIRFRLVVEPRPGLSRARNRGMAEAINPRVAFTDDDVLVDPSWLEGLARGFARDPTSGCVTGLVPSAQLDSASQLHFDARVWWSSGTTPHVYDLSRPSDESRLFPFDAGTIGTGANFAIDRDLIQGLGGFDEALGAGSPARGGEDLDAFVRVLRAGRSIVYEPSAIAWHVHRMDEGDLRSLMYGYGVGLSAYATKYLIDRETRGDVLRRAPLGALHMLKIWERSNGDRRGRSSFALAEARGMVVGPYAYLKARRSARGSRS